MDNYSMMRTERSVQDFRDAAADNARMIMNELGSDLGSIEALLDICSLSAHCPRVHEAYQAVLDVAAAKYAQRREREDKS